MTRKPADRSDWPLRKITDPEELENETYRYWASRTVGERLEAVWEVSQAACAIRLDTEAAGKRRRKNPGVGIFGSQRGGG